MLNSEVRSFAISAFDAVIHLNNYLDQNSLSDQRKQNDSNKMKSSLVCTLGPPSWLENQLLDQWTWLNMILKSLNLISSFLCHHMAKLGFMLHKLTQPVEKAYTMGCSYGRKQSQELSSISWLSVLESVS